MPFFNWTSLNVKVPASLNFLLIICLESQSFSALHWLMPKFGHQIDKMKNSGGTLRQNEKKETKEKKEKNEKNFMEYHGTSWKIMKHHETS